MYKIASRYFMYTLGLLAVKKALKREQKVKGLEIPSFRGVIEVKSAIEGRVRFKLPSIKGDEEKFFELEEQLGRISNITKVETNYITGSILIEYKDDIEPTLIVGILIKLLGLEEKIKGGANSKLTKEFKSIEESLGLAIEEKTKGLLDLKSVMFLALTIVGIKKMIKYPKLTPPGFNYLWWGYSAMNL